MPFVFVIPGALREFSKGQSEVRVEGQARTLDGALRLLWDECPGARDRVMNERGEIRAHINVFVDGRHMPRAGGLAEAIRDGAEIIILPAISGG